MKIFTHKNAELDLEKISRKIVQAERRKDSHGIPLGYKDLYVLKKKRHGNKSKEKHTSSRERTRVT